MENNIVFFISVLLFQLFISCDEKIVSEMPNPDGVVQVELSLPGTYAQANSRAIDLNPEPPKTPLPEGSTLWLAISKKDEESYFDTHLEPKPYIVLAEDAGYQSLYPIEMIEEGDLLKANPEIQTSIPLYLSSGTYKFRMMSPAKPLKKPVDKKGFSASVDNGEYFYATDDRYFQTEAREIIVNIDPEKTVQRIVLNPMLNQTAQIKIKLNKGKSVHTLEVYPNGVEISGIQNNVTKTDFNWFSENLADTLVAKRGDKRGRVYINEFDIHADGSISAATGILPTNAQSNSVVLFFTVKVNGIPTQLQAMLNQMIFRHAYSYNFVFDVDIEEGITVATPIYNSWTITEYV